MPQNCGAGPASVRLEHVLRLLRHRYGPTLAGLDDAELLLPPVAVLLVATRRERGQAVDSDKIVDRLCELAPTVGRQELESMMTLALASSRPWSTAILGEFYKVTVAEREALRLWQLRPAGVTAAEWRVQQKERERQRSERRRREQGKQTRQQYVANAALIKRLAAEHDVSKQTIRNWIKQGRLESPTGFQPAEFESPTGFQPAEFESPTGFQPAEFESPTGFQPAEFESPTGKNAEQAVELQNLRHNKSKAEREPSRGAPLYDQQALAQAPKARGAADEPVKQADEIGDQIITAAIHLILNREICEIDESYFGRTYEIGARLLESYTDLGDDDICAAASGMAQSFISGKSLLGDTNSEAAAFRAVARRRFENAQIEVPF